jgi:membrane-bound metal-dependent hydrolase YbcI (DUF457 family)
MFIGHYAVGFGAKKAAPGISLGTLFLASQLVDLLWPLFLLLGIEHVRIDPGNTSMTPLDFYDYPFTHSLAGAIVWGIALGAVHFAIKRNRRSAALLALVVISHWVLDFITHRPDLPLLPGGMIYVGLGLWNSVTATVVVEVTLFVAGIFFYVRSTSPRDRIGSIGLWSLVALLGIIYAGNLMGPPPPDAGIIAVAGNASWLFVVLAYWIDRHRMPGAA